MADRMDTSKLGTRTTDPRRGSMFPMKYDTRTNAMRLAMENYGLRPDVHTLLAKFLTDLLIAQPADPFAYMQTWVDKEDKERKAPPPKKPAPPQPPPPSKWL